MGASRRLAVRHLVPRGHLVFKRYLKIGRGATIHAYAFFHVFGTAHVPGKREIVFDEVCGLVLVRHRQPASAKIFSTLRRVMALFSSLIRVSSCYRATSSLFTLLDGLLTS